MEYVNASRTVNAERKRDKEDKSVQKKNALQPSEGNVKSRSSKKVKGG